MPSQYKPNVNDYVKWNNLEGWVYFCNSSYITIEISVKEKICDKGTFHKKDHLLVLCYSNKWNELEYVTSRQSKYDTDVPPILVAHNTPTDPCDAL